MRKLYRFGFACTSFPTLIRLFNYELVYTMDEHMGPTRARNIGTGTPGL